MDTDKRKHPRFSPNGLEANINIDLPPPGGEINLEGTVIDMSYTGVKIKLNHPFNTNISESQILINLTLPESGVPVSIRGVIKHISPEAEYGLQYSEMHSEQNVDDLMFECIKLAASHLQ